MNGQRRGNHLAVKVRKYYLTLKDNPAMSLQIMRESNRLLSIERERAKKRELAGVKINPEATFPQGRASQGQINCGNVATVGRGQIPTRWNRCGNYHFPPWTVIPVKRDGKGPVSISGQMGNVPYKNVLLLFNP